MEKLQPVLKQIFWICFALSMMLVLFGWWSASADLTEQITARETAVKQAFTEAGKNVEGVVPNARWTEAANKKNEAHEKALDRAAGKLWEDQLSARVYPRTIRDDLNRIEFGRSIEDDALRGRFAQLYDQYWRSQLDVIRPFENGEGLVDCSSAQITKENSEKWARKIPTTPEIWNALEDIWLLHSVCESIAMVNKDATRIDKAPLRVLMKLQLRGGDPDTEPGSSGGGGGGFGDIGMGEGMTGMTMGPGGDFGGGGFGGGGRGGAAGSGPWTAFEGSLSADLLTEEFGSVGGAGGGFGGGGGYAMEMSGMGGPADGSYDSGNTDGGDGAGTDPSRYVHDEEGMPYRTRAFILEVKILQQAIPSLLAELTNSKFPVEIVRVDAAFGNSSGGSLMTGGGGGMGGYAQEMGGAGDYGSGGEMSMGGMGMGGGMGGYAAEMGGGMGMSAPGGMGGMGGGGMGGLSTGLGGLGGGRRGAGGRGAKPLTAAEQRKIAMGERILADAMRDPDLSTVRVAGLMTVFRSPEEEEAEAEAEAAAEAEAQTSGGADMTQQPDMQDLVDPADAAADGTQPADGAEPVEGTQPAGGLPGNAIGTDGAAGPNGTPPAMPAPSTDPAAVNPGDPNTTDPTPPATEAPVEGGTPAEGDLPPTAGPPAFGVPGAVP